MNKDILQGKWKQLKGSVQARWGQITDDEIDQIQGNFERLVGILQEKYGHTRQEAEDEVRKFLEKEEVRFS